MLASGNRDERSTGLTRLRPSTSLEGATAGLSGARNRAERSRYSAATLMAKACTEPSKRSASHSAHAQTRYSAAVSSPLLILDSGACVCFRGDRYAGGRPGGGQPPAGRGGRANAELLRGEDSPPAQRASVSFGVSITDFAIFFDTFIPW